jgi:hypothetical protein
MGLFFGEDMDKKIAGLLGAAAALTTMASAQAAPSQQNEMAPATSYRDLLDPIADAVPLLKSDNARLADEASRTEVAQVSVKIGHGHHHHHHHVVVVRHPHHHHHHHHTVVIHHD